MFEFSKDDSLTGFRLQRLEVLNWGTFHGKIWKIEPLGFNSLLTGDIGSGKSTLVDALTTLLVQHNKITYNKAAGAEGKERNLYRYIRGAYANTRGEELSAKPQYLREKDSHTVLLASFYNDGYGQKYTLAQVFWLRDDEVQKMYIISSGDLNIREHFTGFGTEISELKK
ncbi:MAG TPA: ATP-binding protein, partial [Leptospiraceae bacterium]|nr:ATP-binding protein [Leptospiraceae bacterium]